MAVPVIDPTKNVLDVVNAESKFQNAMREAETRRVNELDRQRDRYEARIATMLKESMQTTSTILSTQLTNMQNTYDRRLAELEKFRYESGGKWSGVMALFSIVAAIGSIVAIVVAFRGGI